MSNLSILNYDNSNIRFETRNGVVWVSLTDMAKATGKRVNDWSRLKLTEDFIYEMESVTGIPVTETVQGGTPDKQGTWAIEEVAIEFAQWCNVRFKIWVIKQIKTLMKEGSVSLKPVTNVSNPSELEVLEFCLNPLKEYVDKALVDGVRLNYAERKYPELKGELNEMRSLIAGSNKIDTVLITPTKIGQYLGERLGVKYSPKLINQLLIEYGYQIVNPKKTSKDDPKYLPTKKGLPFSIMSLATGKVGDNTSYQHLKWLESLVDELEELLKV